MELQEFQKELDVSLKTQWKNGITNIDKMMTRRGYEWKQKIENFFHQYEHKKSKKRVVICLFSVTKLCIESLREIIKLCEYVKIRSLILILQNTWSSNCKKILDNLINFQTEYFFLKEFQYDLTELHYYVPHEKIEQKDLIHEIKVNYKNSIPVLLKSDPVSRYFGFQRGDFIKILRNDLGVNVICYRIVK